MARAKSRVKTSAEEFGPHVGYRRYVGPAQDYDLMSGLQFSVLFALGLREDHRLLDIGCGSLRGGRLFIPYLAPDRYFGIEPNDWLLQEGIAENISDGLVELKRPRFLAVDDFSFEQFGTDFDFMLAQSILSHTYEDLMITALEKSRAVLADGGTFVGTFLWPRPAFDIWTNKPRGDTGHGWVYPDVVTYKPSEVDALLERVDLAGRVLPMYHPRQTWFVAVKRRESARLDELLARARNAFHAPTTLELAKKRAIRLAYLRVKWWRDRRAAR